MAFLTETDTKNVDSPEDYKIEGYETILPKIHNDKKKRIIALKKTDSDATSKIRDDLMSPDFPSIWIEWESTYTKNTLIGGFYREWSQVGTTTDKEQCELLETFSEQMTRANAEGKNVIVLGDANLDSGKWNDPGYRHHKVAVEMQSTLSRNGMKNMTIGNTYMSEQSRGE